MANEITAAELVANVRAKMDMLPADMAKAEGIVTGAAKRMNSGAGTAGTGIGASMGKGIQTGLSSFLGGGAGMLLAGGIAGGLALVAKEAIGAAGELAAMGRQSERIGASFTRLWGEEAPGAMETLRAASLGAISDMDLMLAANKASMLGVGSGIDDLAKLMQVAQVRGQALGLSASQAFSDIVTGIGRMSPLILDNLGIVTDAENTYRMYAESIGKSADTLTDVEKKQALVNRVTSEAGQVASDSTSAHAGLAAAKENLRSELGLLIDGFITETGVVEKATGALNTFTETVRKTNDVNATIKESTAEYIETMGRAAESYGMNSLFADRYAARMDALTQQYKNGEISLGTYRARLAEMNTDLANAYGMMTRADIAAADLQESLVRDAAAAYGAARGFGAAGNAASTMASQIAAAAKRQYSVYGYEIYGSARGSYDAVQSRVEYLQEENERRVIARQIEGGREEQLASQSRAAAKSVDIAQQQFDAIRGIVESALSPTAVTAADLAATAAGTYVAKWDEYMRRIRMPESGLGADQIAEQERLFYSGQMMDQINWSAVVSDVGRKVQEEAGKEAMIQEAMRQVAAAGIGASQSQVAAAMGMTGYAAGTGEAEQMAKGLTATGLGIQFTEQFEDEFIQQQERWVDMGALSVAWMATGIERGTTPQVAGLLINLLLPRLEEILMGGARP